MARRYDIGDVVIGGPAGAFTVIVQELVALAPAWFVTVLSITSVPEVPEVRAAEAVIALVAPPDAIVGETLVLEPWKFHW